MPVAELVEFRQILREAKRRSAGEAKRRSAGDARRSTPRRARRRPVPQEPTGFEPFLIAAPLGLCLWALIIWAVVAIVS